MALLNGYALRTVARETQLERGLWMFANFVVAAVVILVARKVDGRLLGLPSVPAARRNGP